MLSRRRHRLRVVWQRHAYCVFSRYCVVAAVKGVGRHVPTARRCCGATPRFSRMASENTTPPSTPRLVVDRRDFDAYSYEFFFAFTRTTLNVDENQGPPFKYFNNRLFQCRIGEVLFFRFSSSCALKTLVSRRQILICPNEKLIANIVYLLLVHCNR